jgi:hypothetical protein
VLCWKNIFVSRKTNSLFPQILNICKHLCRFEIWRTQTLCLDSDKSQMLSNPHETLRLLFQNRPALAAELLRDALNVTLPEYTEARITSADFTDIQPAEYRADLVVLLLQDSPVLGIVLEIQLSRDENKPWVWPVYVTSLRARIRCPVCLLVMTAEENIARWAGRIIELGGGNRFVPSVLSPSGVPEVTDESQAKKDPELAVLSAMAHGHDPDPHKSVRIALLAQMASVGLDAERSTMYCDLVLNSLSEVARQALQAMDTSKYEYKSDFARLYYGKGVTDGRLGLILKLLATRYGQLSQEAKARVHDASPTDLDGIAQRLLTAQTLDEALWAA